jgi:hypothetical protein
MDIVKESAFREQSLWRTNANHQSADQQTTQKGGGHQKKGCTAGMPPKAGSVRSGVYDHAEETELCFA